MLPAEMLDEFAKGTEKFAQLLLAVNTTTGVGLMVMVFTSAAKQEWLDMAVNDAV